MLLQTHNPLLRPLTTAHLAQTMSLLELTSTELRQKVEAELASNPALELSDESRCRSCHRPLPAPGICPVCRQGDILQTEQPIVFVTPYSDFAPGGGKYEEEDTPLEEKTARYEDLPTFVLRQIAPELLPEERIIAAHILTSLDDDGLLTIPILEIARYYHVPTAQVEKVQSLIQRAEPVGVGSNSAQQALLVQLDVLAEYSLAEYSLAEYSLAESHQAGSFQAEYRSVPPLAKQAIEKGMQLLARHAYQELGRLLKISTEEARLLTSFIIDNLNPYPARAYWGDIHLGLAPKRSFQQPDIIISLLDQRADSPLVIEVISPYAGRLQINPLFREALSDAPANKLEQWQADLDNASLLVKCLQQRDHTLVRLMQRLANLQRQFILEGDASLQPLTRASLALELDVHESTISRAVSDKAVQLPNKRIISLSKFFDRSLHIRTALKQIVAEERSPLSDTQLADRLNRQGFDVARRTVAKYRAIEGILPARLRQPIAMSCSL